MSTHYQPFTGSHFPEGFSPGKAERAEIDGVIFARCAEINRGPNTDVETMVVVLANVFTHRDIARMLNLHVRTVARIRQRENPAAKNVADALARGSLK